MGKHHQLVRGIASSSLFAAALFVSSCGGQKSNTALSGGAKPLTAAPTLKAAPSATTPELVASTAEIATDNIAACSDFIASPSELQNFMNAAIAAGKAKVAAGQSPGVEVPDDGELSASACRAYLQDSFEKLGGLVATGEIENAELSAWLTKVVAWLFEQNASSGSGTGDPIGVLFMTSMGARVQGASCPAGSSVAGGIADCANGICNGIQSLCLTRTAGAFSSAAASEGLILVAAQVTTHNAHVASPACPADHRPLGVGADCGGGVCNGNQVLCGKFVAAKTLSSGGQYIRDILVTKHNAHVTAVCPATHPRALGGYADCGMGVCNGTQLFCASVGQRI